MTTNGRLDPWGGDPADERESPETPHTHPGNLASHGTLAKTNAQLTFTRGGARTSDLIGLAGNQIVVEYQARDVAGVPRLRRPVTKPSR